MEDHGEGHSLLLALVGQFHRDKLMANLALNRLINVRIFHHIGIKRERFIRLPQLRRSPFAVSGFP